MNGYEIIINADDLGLSPGVNKAILEAFDKGIINSSTLMATMDGFEDAVENIHERKLEKYIGVHLVLTDGQPLTQGVLALPYLFKGNMPLKSRLRQLMFFSKSEETLIYEELAAQLQRVRNNGLPISHIDTHHQIHDMMGIQKIMFRLLKEFEIPAMRILNNLENRGLSPKNAYRSFRNLAIGRGKRNFTAFLGDQLDFIKMSDTNPGLFHRGSTEIMVHPTYNADNELADLIEGKTYGFEQLTALLESKKEFVFKPL